MIFSLQRACELLPHVEHVTADAVRQAESLTAQLRGVAEDDPDHASLSAALRDLVNRWAEDMRSLGLEAKGPWLVDSTTARAITAGPTRSRRSATSMGTTKGSMAG